MMLQHDIVGTTKDGSEKIKFTNNKFSDIIFSLGKVYFSEDEVGDPKLNFHYDIHMHSVDSDFNKKEFEDMLALFIVERIRLGIEQNDLIYTGGTDED